MAKLGLDKIVLRRIESGDREVLQAWLKDPTVRAAIEDEVIDLSNIDQALHMFEQGDPYRDGGLGLVVEANGRLIGMIYFVWINWLSRNAEVIVFVGPGELRRSLIAAVVMEKIGHAAFRVLNLHKIYAFVYGANAAALSVFRKVMKEEACLRAYVKGSDGYSNFHFFGVLAAEYFATLDKITGVLEA